MKTPWSKEPSGFFRVTRIAETGFESLVVKTHFSSITVKTPYCLSFAHRQTTLVVVFQLPLVASDTAYVVVLSHQPLRGVGGNKTKELVKCLRLNLLNKFRWC